MPEGYLIGAILAWSAWSAASYAWSIHPVYSRAEIGTEVGWGLATAAIFYVVARTDRAFRAVMVTAIGACALLALLALYAAADRAGFRSRPRTGALPRRRRRVFHAHRARDAAPPHADRAAARRLRLGPCVDGDSHRALPAAARGGANDREPHDLGRLRRRIPARGHPRRVALAGAPRPRAAALGRRARRAARRPRGLVRRSRDAANACGPEGRNERRAGDRRRSTAHALAALLRAHPRAPLARLGFGKSILREELQGELGDPLLAHAHNLFVSQWLQTGIVGLARLRSRAAGIGATGRSCARPGPSPRSGSSAS